MARPREFDRDLAVKRAMSVFWDRGYAATSTDDLLRAMKIGRQSMYGAFGDKRKLYVEALEKYQRDSVAGHIERLRAPQSPLAGLKAMLTGVIAPDKRTREMGCMGTGSACEFGNSDAELTNLRSKSAAVLRKALIERLREAKTKGEIANPVAVEQAADFVATAMMGLQVAARGGAGLQSLRDTASFTVERLKKP